jgi:hypothetical protein
MKIRQRIVSRHDGLERTLGRNSRAAVDSIAILYVEGEITVDLLDAIKSLIKRRYREIVLNLADDALNTSGAMLVVVQALTEVTRHRGTLHVRDMTKRTQRQTRVLLPPKDGTSGGNAASAFAHQPAERRPRRKPS